ncbi:MAG: 4Fe-4S dicluster domain-containing protein [Planctomycetota bacterium]|jgi:reductive dehalogenase
MSVYIASAVVLIVLGFAVLTGLAAFGLVSVREREPRAARVAFLLAVAGSLPLFVAAGLPFPVRVGALAAILALALGSLVLWLLPIGAPHPANGRPTRRVDERDIMFARARLRPNSKEYETYYSMRPEHKESDDRTRSLPGLLSPGAAKADPALFAAAEASFAVCDALREEVDGAVARERRETPAPETTVFVKKLALDLGARDVGVTELRPYHLYTHIGRGTGTWGDPIRLDHRWAIAFTVEMDHAAMQRAPAAPVVAESARQYVESARIAVGIASRIRARGYPARAHIDGNYRVIAPLVGRDAGLGEIGRIGILMTPRLGPRVRLGVVTTDLPLAPDRPGDDISVIGFCTVCKKCAESCPSRSIPLGGRTPIDDGHRWAIDPDSCFRYWNAIGTDCGLCMSVCPYSHPDSFAHNLVRGVIRRSGAGRRVALWMDDLFYGRRSAGGH